MYRLLPKKEKFVEYATIHERVPILGCAHVPGLDISGLFRKLYFDDPNAFLFESGKGPEEINKYSIMGASGSTLAWSDGNKATLLSNGEPARINDDPLRFLEQIQISERLASFEYAPPFWGGWAGYLGYEFAQRLEKFSCKPQEENSLPEYFFMLVDRIWVYEHATGILNFVVAQEPGTAPVESYEGAVTIIQEAWEKFTLAGNEKNPEPDRKKHNSDPATNGLRSNLSLEAYSQIVNRAKDYIVEGDIYQANLVQNFTTDMKECPFELYLKLKAINPAPFSGYLKTPFATLVSSSPERLIKVENGWAETRPIAGTRPRGADLAEDERLSAELLLNEKEKAEHLMLVDLERNDLGRICQTGTVEVDALMFLEKYSHVIHIVSNIRGQLKQGLNLVDVLKGVFPGGTITGCPKIRCMEIIDELETDSRGPYSGSMGYIGFGSAIDLNILIRTIVVQNGKASFHVGAGIVADSNPEREYRETLDKAAAMMEALTGERP